MAMMYLKGAITFVFTLSAKASSPSPTQTSLLATPSSHSTTTCSPISPTSQKSTLTSKP